MAGFRDRLSEVELTAFLQGGDHWIPGTKGAGQTLSPWSGASVQAHWEMWERDSGEESQFPGSKYLALMSISVYCVILYIPHAQRGVSAPCPLGFPESALFSVWLALGLAGFVDVQHILTCLLG